MYGRFPHRNAILGRTDTPDEIEYNKLGRIPDHKLPKLLEKKPNEVQDTLCSDDFIPIPFQTTPSTGSQNNSTTEQWRISSQSFGTPVRVPTTIPLDSPIRQREKSNFFISPIRITTNVQKIRLKDRLGSRSRSKQKLML